MPRGGNESAPHASQCSTSSRPWAAAVQNGAVELHTWGATVPDIKHPDRITRDELHPKDDLLARFNVLNVPTGPERKILRSVCRREVTLQRACGRVSASHS